MAIDLGFHLTPRPAAIGASATPASALNRSLPRRLEALLEKRVDNASLVAFRILFGLLMLVAVARFFAHGWIEEYFLKPKYFFSYYGLDWVRPWPGAGMYLHFAVLGLLALLIACGAFYRASSALFGLGLAYAHLTDKTNYLNHYYLLICLSLLMAWLPLHRAFSVHTWRKPERRKDTAPAWALYALRAQVGLVYCFGGLAKLRPDWLLSAQPLKIWLGANPDFPLLGNFFEQNWLAYAASYAGAAFDLSVVPLLLWRRSRPFAYGAVVVFHLCTARLFQLGMFPWIMIGATLLFFEPDWPRRLVAWISGLGQTVSFERFQSRHAVDDSGTDTQSRTRSEERESLWHGRAWALGAYFTFQVLMPLRQLLYPGNGCWTEQGFRFSWNVMLIEKNGSVEFRVRDRESDREWHINPNQFLTHYQTKMMATQPDMILQFAQFLAAQFRGWGLHDPEVRTDAFVSLNGRPAERFIDPEVDLSEERDSLAHKPWILPFPKTTPP